DSPEQLNKVTHQRKRTRQRGVMPRLVQSVDDNILGDLTHEFPFGPQEHKIGLETTPVKMAKKRYKHTFCATRFHGANEENNLLAMICIHYCQFIMSR